MSLNQTEIETTQQITTVALSDDRLAKFQQDHLRTWVYGDQKRLDFVRHWVAEAVMDATGLPVAAKHWSVVEHVTKETRQ